MACIKNSGCAHSSTNGKNIVCVNGWYWYTFLDNGAIGSLRTVNRFFWPLDRKSTLVTNGDQWMPMATIRYLNEPLKHGYKSVDSCFAYAKA